MKPVETWIIYVLKNPRTGEVRYVGWSSRSAKSRLKAHVQSAVVAGRLRGSHKNRWVLSLLSIGLKPELEVIESGIGKEGHAAERRWIAFYRERGANLLNRSDGGEGNPGYLFTAEARAKISAKNKGRKLSPEHKAKLIAAGRAAAIGSHWTPERKKQQSDRLKGIPRPPEVIAKWHANHKGRVVSAKTREILAAHHRGKKASSETRAKMRESGLKRAQAELSTIPPRACPYCERAPIRSAGGYSRHVTACKALNPPQSPKGIAA